MNKRDINISTIEDLEREEVRVMRRIRKQEVELVSRMKQLPEEIVTAGAVKIISSVVEGSALRSIMNTVKKIGKNIISTIMDNPK
jgi:hypothetical protein